MATISPTKLLKLLAISWILASTILVALAIHVETSAGPKLWFISQVFVAIPFVVSFAYAVWRWLTDRNLNKAQYRKILIGLAKIEMSILLICLAGFALEYRLRTNQHEEDFRNFAFTASALCQIATKEMTNKPCGELRYSYSEAIVELWPSEEYSKSSTMQEFARCIRVAAVGRHPTSLLARNRAIGCGRDLCMRAQKYGENRIYIRFGCSKKLYPN